MIMLDAAGLTLAVAVVATFLVAGFVKGVIGLGLPVIAVALLTAVIGIKEAMVLMLAPSFVTNVWQAVAGGRLAVLGRRLASLLLAVGVGIWLGAGWLASADARALNALLGATLAVYAALALGQFRLPSPGNAEWWWSPIVGIVNGVLTGLTGSFTVPGVPYLQALGLRRDELIQAMGLLFLGSTVMLAIALQQRNLLTAALGTYSLAGIVPALAGMWLGQRLRNRLDEATFRRTFLVSLLILGAYIASRALV